MSFNVDIAGDFGDVVDWLNPATVDGTEVDHCLRRAIDTKEAAASGGKYLASDVAFHVDIAERATRPAIGGSIVDDDGTWTILSVAKQTLANRWRCVCRLLWIDPTLTVTIQKATFAKGITGANEPTWTTLASGVVAKIHIEEREVESTRANRTTRTRANVYFAAPQAITVACRVVASDGAIYKILSWDGFDDIENLFRATAEVSKWPEA